MVKRLDGWCSGGDPAIPDENYENEKMVVEIRWKGPKIGLTSFRRTVKKNVTKEGLVQNGVVEWEEQFMTVCTLSGFKDNVFHLWDISFAVLNVSFFIHYLFILSVYVYMYVCMHMFGLSFVLDNYNYFEIDV